jgi:hypothetical protein
MCSFGSSTGRRVLAELRVDALLEDEEMQLAIDMAGECGTTSLSDDAL